MPNDIKIKSTFGSSNVGLVSPPLPEATPKAINLNISFEEALKLHLSLGQALARLNGYNRSTKKGREACVNLCFYTKINRIAVLEGRIRQR